MRGFMNIISETATYPPRSGDYMDTIRQRHTEEIAARYPDIQVGQFVQLNSWFGDVWAEITRVFISRNNPRYSSVSFVMYEKYGVSRKPDSTSFAGIRKIATKDEINFSREIVHTPSAHYSFGNVTEWPEGVPPRRGSGGYEFHPTLDKPDRRTANEAVETNHAIAAASQAVRDAEEAYDDAKHAYRDPAPGVTDEELVELDAEVDAAADRLEDAKTHLASLK